MVEAVRSVTVTVAIETNKRTETFEREVTDVDTLDDILSDARIFVENVDG